MRIAQRIATIALLVALGGSLWANGTVETKQAVTPSSQGTDLSVKQHFTIGVKDDIVVSDWKDNWMTKYIEDKLNVDLEFIKFSSKEMGTKLNLIAMDGGDALPDIIFYSASDNDVTSWSQMGLLQPLSNYYQNEKLSANIQESWQRTGVDYRGQITSPDGEIYVIPALNQSYGNESQVKFWYYKPFLDKLGLSVPTTTEELENVLKAVVNGDPNGNGIKDEIGISGDSFTNSFATDPSGWFIFLMNSFVYAGGEQYMTVDDNGTVSFAYTTDEWKEGLRYIRKLFAEGLIQDASLTQDRTAMRALMNADTPQVCMFSWVTGVGLLDGKSPRKDEYIGMMPFTGPQGAHYIEYRPSTATARMMISKNCKDPERAFMIGDLMSGEFLSIVTRWGEPGKDWDYLKDMKDPDAYEGMYEAIGFDKYIVVYDDATFWSSGTAQNKSYRQQGPYVRQYGIANGQAKNKGAFSLAEKNLAKYQYDLRQDDYLPKHVIPKLIYNAEETEAISEIKMNLMNYVNEYCGIVLAGQQDLDKSWDGFQKELKTIGIDEYRSVTQKVYDRMYGTK